MENNNINSASRILSILEEALKKNSREQTVKVWANVFNIEIEDSSEEIVAVSDNLSYVYKELQIIKKQLKNLNLNKDIYSENINFLEQATSPWNLSHEWSNQIGFLRPQEMLSLKYWQQMLPNEENAIQREDISKIIELIDELESTLEDNNLPYSIVELIKHQVTLIREAINKYPISGATALKSAVESGIGELTLYRETIKENQDKLQLKKLSVIWDKVSKVTDKALKAERIYQLGNKITEFLLNTLQ